jgi:hypothetical protein
MLLTGQGFSSFDPRRVHYDLWERAFLAVTGCPFGVTIVDVVEQEYYNLSNRGQTFPQPTGSCALRGLKHLGKFRHGKEVKIGKLYGLSVSERELFTSTDDQEEKKCNAEKCLVFLRCSSR